MFEESSANLVMMNQSQYGLTEEKRQELLQMDTFFGYFGTAQMMIDEILNQARGINDRKKAGSSYGVESVWFLFVCASFSKIAQHWVTFTQIMDKRYVR